MKKPFITTQSNPNQKGGYVTKLVRETIVKDPIFGEKTKKETLYISGSKQIPNDTEVPAEHIENNFVVREHEMMNPDTGEVFMGKWLHLK